MKKTVLLYGILGGLLVAVLKVVEYRYLVIEHSLEIYGGIVAVIFSALGIWLGLKLTRPRETVITREVPVEIRVPVTVPVTGPFVRNQPRVEQPGERLRYRWLREAAPAGDLGPRDRARRADQLEHCALVDRAEQAGRSR